MSIISDASFFQNRVVDGWGLYDANNKNQKKRTVHNPRKNRTLKRQ
jgi:hypothetical protein